jgi:hypothetical protein
LAQVGLAYQARAKPKAAVTPAIAQLAKDLTVNSNTPEDKVRALHQWVAQNIRYLGIYVGAGGFVPHDAQTILDNRYPSQVTLHSFKSKKNLRDGFGPWLTLILRFCRMRLSESTLHCPKEFWPDWIQRPCNMARLGRA